MRITRVKPFPLFADRQYMFVKVETDEGIYGIGEAGITFREWAIEGAIRHLESAVVGQDPFRTEHLGQKMARWCEAHYIKLACHNPLGPVNTAACLHLDLASDNVGVQECPRVPGGYMVDLFPVQAPFEGATCCLPKAPAWASSSTRRRPGSTRTSQATRRSTAAWTAPSPTGEGHRTGQGAVSAAQRLRQSRAASHLGAVGGLRRQRPEPIWAIMGASQIKNGRCHITDERVAIFIDGSNLYHALRDGFHRVDLNFGEFTRKLVGQRRLARVYYYNILQEPSQRPEGARDQQEFLETLRRTPYMEIRLGKTKLLQGVPVEKGIDIMLATDLLHFAANGLYDTAVLVSGDGDFAYAVQAVKNLGRHVEVAYIENHTSRDLLEAADFAHLLDRTFLSSLWGGKGKGGGRRRGSGRSQQRPSEGQPSPAGQPTGQLGAPLGGQPV